MPFSVNVPKRPNLRAMQSFMRFAKSFGNPGATLGFSQRAPEQRLRFSVGHHIGGDDDDVSDGQTSGLTKKLKR